VSIRQYERAMESLSAYSRTVEMGFQVVLRARRGEFAPAQERAMDRVGAIVFGSDQGMCGQFNDQVVAFVLHWMDEFGIPREKRRAMAVGWRAATRLEEAGQQVESVFTVPGSVAAMTTTVENVLMKLDEWASERHIEQIYLFHQAPISGVNYEPKAVHLLPLDPERLRQIEAKPWPSRVLPTFSLNWDRLFSALVQQHLFVWLYRALAESLAGENASRLASMQAAEKNIEEHLTTLNDRYHQERQNAITEELLDIVSGFEVLVGGSGRFPGAPS
jgi:F-type H+-transporting ATPase subunit gamma